MGIGVYEAREFVRGLGGEMEVHSTPGEGTTVRLTLPLADGGSRGQSEPPHLEMVG